MKVEIDGDIFILPFEVADSCGDWVVVDQNFLPIGDSKAKVEYITAALNEKAAREAKSDE